MLMRIPHMVHLYRRRAMFPLPATAVVSWSLTVALQLMLFPDTPTDVLRVVAPQDVDQVQSPAVIYAERPEPTPGVVAAPQSPIAQDVLSASSGLFAEYGYYAVGMEEIAAAADLSRATLYRYFSTKDRILAELTVRAVIEIEEHAAALPRMGVRRADRMDGELRRDSTARTAVSSGPGSTAPWQSSSPTRWSMAWAQSIGRSLRCWIPSNCRTASTPKWPARYSWRFWAE